jgi:putative endonuclease
LPFYLRPLPVTPSRSPSLGLRIEGPGIQHRRLFLRSRVLLRRIEGRGSEARMARPFFAYMLRCADGAYYVGHTDDLEKRVSEHQEGGKCAYTERRRPVQLIWSEEFATREDALAAELQIKKWSRIKKEALASGAVEELRRAARKDWAAYRQHRQPP